VKKSKSFKTNSSQKSKKAGLFFGVFLVFVLAYLVQKDISLPSWVIAGCAMLGFVVLFIKSFQSPMPAVLALVCYVPFSKVLVGDFGGNVTALNFTNILMVFIFIGMLIQLTSKSGRLLEKNALNIPILLFCILTGVSFLKGSAYFGYYREPLTLFIEVKRWLTPMLIFYLSYNSIRDRNSCKTVVKIIMLVVFLVGAMATLDYINVGSVSNFEKARIGGISDQPNQLAGFFVYYIFFYAGFFLMRFPSLAAWAFLVPMLVAFRGIMVTFSRGGYVSFAVGALATCFFKNKILFVVVTALMFFAVLNPQFLPGGIRYRMGQTLISGGNFYEADLEDSLEMSSRRK